MKRRVLMLLLLVAGAIVNVAVAWGCVLALPPKFDQIKFAPNERLLTGAEGLGFLQEMFRDVHADHEEIYGTTQHRIGWSSREATWMFDYDPGLFIHADATFAGWPMYSLWGCSQWDGRKPSESTGPYRGALPVPEWAKPEQGYRRLIEFVPWIPIWPGFAINTLFYAVILSVLLAAPFALRRRLRRKRGLCPACGYQVGVSEVCTECGKSVTPRRGDGV